MHQIQDFLASFRFRPELAGCVGIERERFLVSPEGAFAPRADEFLSEMRDAAWTYELSRCQVEDRTRSARDHFIVKANLLSNDNRGKFVAAKIGLGLQTLEVAPESMPLDVYPEPRYLAIAEKISRETLSAACRVAGTHIHLGMRNMDEAIAAYNLLRAELETLTRLGDHSGGERIRLYRAMAGKWNPPQYRDEQELFEIARQEGFAENSRNCWHLIRITQKGTVECRMFGVTVFPDEILEWVSAVRRIARGV